MKKVLTLVAAILLTSWATLFAQEADTESLVGQTYTGQTTPVPKGTTWQNADTSPGVYSKLQGTYTINLNSDYYMISTFLNWMEGKVLVVNEENVIVYEATMGLTPAGGRSFTQMFITIPEENAITTPGTYRIIYPTSSGWDVPNDAYITRNEKVQIYNLEAGPYVVGEIGNPVPAEVTVVPQGDFEVENSPEFVSIKVGNASIFNCEDIDNVITVTDSSGTAIEMEPGTKSDNELKWEFPFDVATGKAAVLPKGSYTITVNYGALKAYTSDLNPLEFPTDNVYTFNIEGGMTRLVPECTITPEPGAYPTWTAAGITVKFNDYKLNCSVADVRKIEMVMLDPDSERTTITPINRSTVQQLGYQPGQLTKDGTYKFILKLDGLQATNNSTGEVVEFQNLEFEYVVGNPAVDAVYTTDPASNSSIITEDFKQVKLTVSNAASIDVAADAPGLLSIINDATQEVIAVENPTVAGNVLTWTLPSTWTPEVGNYSVVISLAEGVTGKTSDDANIKFPDTIEYTITLTAPIQRTEVNPNPTITPAAGQYEKWTATSIVCKWDTKYKLDKEGRDLYIGRVITIQKPDGTTQEITLSKATDKGIGKINFLQTEITVSAETFAEPGKYIVTFPIKGLTGAEAANSNNFIIFDRDAVVEYTVGKLPVDAVYTLNPANNASLSSTEFKQVKLTVSNASSLEISAESPSMLTLTNAATEASLSLTTPTVEGNVITWNVPETWTPADGTYKLTFTPATGLSGTAEDGAPLMFTETIESTITIVVPRTEVNPNPTFTPAAGQYEKWTATSIVCKWDTKYKLNKEGRDLYIGRVITIQKPDGTTQEITLSKATDTGIGKINFLQTEITVSAATFAEPGKYIVTFPIKGLTGAEVANANNLIVFDQDAVVEYIILKPVDAAYTTTPAAGSVFEPGAEVPNVKLTVSNAGTLSVAEGTNPLTVKETDNDVTLAMSAPVVDGNTITWIFPEDWNNLPGTYEVTIDGSMLYGKGTEYEVLVFPKTIVSNFVIEAPIVTPTHAITPEPGEYHTWNNEQGIQVNLNDYTIKTEEAVKAVKLIVTDPSEESKEYLPDADKSSANLLVYNVTDEFVNKIGVYNCQLALDNVAGIDNETNLPVRLGSFDFSYEMYGKPIDATFSITPADNAVLAPTDVLSGIQLTVSNALQLTIPEGYKLIGVVETEDLEIVRMSDPILEGNTVTWNFPEGWDNPAGSYKVTILTGDFTGVGADKAEVIFPTSFTSKFVIDKNAVTPQYTVIPEPGEYHTWNNQLGVMVSLTDYTIADKASAETVKLTVTAPDGEVREYLPNSDSGLSFLAYDVTDEFVNKLGEYTCTLELNGIAARNLQTSNKVVLQNINFAYTMYAKPIDAKLSITPDKNTIFLPSEKINAVVLTVENALTLSISEGADVITVIDPNVNIGVEMSAPIIEGNTVTWNFPADWNNPVGQYDVFINLHGFRATGADNAEVVFPEYAYSSFTILAAIVTPEYEASPIPGEYTYWDNDMPVLISLTGYELNSKKAAEDVQLTVTAPDGTKSELKPVSDLTSASILAYQVTDDVMKQLGDYIFTVELSGLSGIDKATGKIVKFRNIELFYTMVPLEVEIDYTSSPVSGSTIGVWTDQEIVIDWTESGYTLDEESIDRLKEMNAVVKRDGLPVKVISLGAAAEDTSHSGEVPEGANISATGLTMSIDPSTFAEDGFYEVAIPFAGLTGFFPYANVPVEFTNDITLDYKVDISSGIDSIVTVGEGEAYYSIAGYRVARPTEKGIYIKVDANGKASRVYIR